MKSLLYKIIVLTMGIVTISQAQTNNPVAEFLVESPYPNPIIIEEDDNGEIYFATLFDGIRKLDLNQNPLVSTRILGTAIPRNNEMAIEGTELFYTEDGTDSFTQKINKVDLNNLSQPPVLLFEKTFAQNESDRTFLGLETKGADLFFWDNNELFKINTSQVSPTPQSVFAESDSNANCFASNIVGDFLYYIFSDGNPLQGNNKIKRINLTNSTSEVILESTSFNPSGRALGVKNDKVYFSNNGQDITIVDVNNLNATPEVFLNNISRTVVNGIINNDLYASTVFNNQSERVIKINISSAESTITNRPNQDTVDGNTTFSYTINIEAEIPKFIIGGDAFDVDFGEVKLQIHEVNSGDVLTLEDTINQQLISESKAIEFNNGLNTLNFELLAPNTTSNDLASNKKYRLRLLNTGIGAVYVNQFAFELTVNEGTVLSVEDIETQLESVNIYPNPTSDELIVPFDMDSLLLYDFSGKLMLKSTENRNSLLGLPEGIYLAKINYKNQSKTIKIIKK